MFFAVTVHVYVVAAVKPVTVRVSVDAAPANDLVTPPPLGVHVAVYPVTGAPPLLPGGV